MEKRKAHGSLNIDECGELAELIEELTHSGNKTLDDAKFKKIKNICKKSDKNVGHVFDLIIHQLEKNHSEIRFSAFQLCDEIFRRSHYFRQLVVDNLHHVLELTAETNPELPLPLPRTAAFNLKRLSLTTVRDWCGKYGSGYKKLVLGFNFLQQCKKVDFRALQLQSDAERAREEEKERRLRAINEERVKKVKNELNEFSVDINGTVKSLNSCLNLLLPKPEEFFISLDNEESNKYSNPSNVDYNAEVIKTNDGSDSSKGVERENLSSRVDEKDSDSEGMEFDEDAEPNIMLREFGAFNTKHTIEINLKLDEVNLLKETSENSAIIDNVRDYVKLITNSYLPRVKGWLQILAKASGSGDTIRNIVDLKIRMENVLEKYGRLNIENMIKDDCVSTDSEMEEVGENEVLKNSNPSCRKVKNSLKTNKKIENQSSWSILSKEECPEDPTTMHLTVAGFSKKCLKTPSVSKAKPSTLKVVKDSEPSISHVMEHPVPSTSKQIVNPLPSKSKVVNNYCHSPSSSNKARSNEINDRKKKLLAVAPKMPFDIDLYHWEDNDLKAPTLLPTSMDTTKFWSSTSGDDLMEVTVPEGSSRFRTRVIEYVGKFEPVSRICRAPLSNGKLCVRQDRYKCPFHGRIVPRDEMGKCVNAEDERKEKAAEERKRVPEWQDPKLLKDIEKATGIDLKMPEKGKRKKKEKKYPGLTDIKAKQNTPKNRLSKVVFKRSAMKRVASVLDKIDQRRFRDKYGEQFHYMYDTA